MRFLLIMSILLVLLTFFSCRKDDPAILPKVVGSHTDTVEQPLPSVVFQFNAKANNGSLLAAKVYTNTSGENFTVSKFNYYISNIKLVKEDGTIFSEPESYHLIQHVEGINSFSINNVPVGNYKEVRFLIGVDSLRNVSGAQTGALDVANNMFWDWNTGYIFYKLEGDFYSAGVPGGAQYAIHIGGFHGDNNCLQNVSHALTTFVQATKGKKSKITYNVNIEEVFDTPQKIGFDSYYAQVSTGPRVFVSISQNYQDMFVVEKVEN